MVIITSSCLSSSPKGPRCQRGTGAPGPCGVEGRHRSSLLLSQSEPHRGGPQTSPLWLRGLQGAGCGHPSLRTRAGHPPAGVGSAPSIAPTTALGNQVAGSVTRGLGQEPARCQIALRGEAGLPTPAGTSQASTLTHLHLGAACAQLALQGGRRVAWAVQRPRLPSHSRGPEHQPAPCSRPPLQGALHPLLPAPPAPPAPCLPPAAPSPPSRLAAGLALLNPLPLLPVTCGSHVCGIASLRLDSFSYNL